MPAEPCGYMGSSIGNVQAMNRVVNPHGSFSIAASPILVISVVVEEVIVNEKRTAVPVWAPSPRSPSSPVGKTEADVETGSESEAKRRVIKRWIISVSRGSPNINRIIDGNVNHFRVGRLDDDDPLPPLLLGDDFLLLRWGQMPIGLRPDAHPLDCIHDIRFLSEKGLSEIGCPLNILVQLLQCIRHNHESLYARVPGLLLGGIDQILFAEILVPPQPLACFHDLERIGAGHKHLTQQRIGIEGDWRHKAIQLIGGPSVRRRWFRL